MEIISTCSNLISTCALPQYTSHYFCQLPISCHLPICLQLRPNSISSSARKENLKGPPGPDKTKKGRSKEKWAGEKQEETVKAMEVEGKKKQKMQPEIQKVCVGEGVKSTGKSNAELEQIPSLGSDGPAPPFQSRSHLQPCVGDRRTLPDGSLTLVCSPLTQPGPGQPPGEKQNPHKPTARSRNAAAAALPH